MLKAERKKRHHFLGSCGATDDDGRMICHFSFFSFSFMFYFFKNTLCPILDIILMCRNNTNWYRVKIPSEALCLSSALISPLSSLIGCLFEQLFYFLNIGPSLNSFSNLAILEMILMFRLKNHMADIDIYCLQIWLAVTGFKNFTWFSATVIISLCLSFLESPEYHGLLISFLNGF